MIDLIDYCTSRLKEESHKRHEIQLLAADSTMNEE